LEVGSLKCEVKLKVSNKEGLQPSAFSLQTSDVPQGAVLAARMSMIEQPSRPDIVRPPDPIDKPPPDIKPVPPPDIPPPAGPPDIQPPMPERGDGVPAI
jgi:hypothetical protein